MRKRRQETHPYIPNSAPTAKEQMLKAIGAKTVDELYEDIPDHLRVGGLLNLPEPLPSEYALRRHVEGILTRNETCQDHLNFLGAGCYQHYVPAICDEINQRGEFLTAYAASPTTTTADSKLYSSTPA